MGAISRWLTGPDPSEVGEDPDPRFSFANERTLLAWTRTAMALVGLGLAVTQLLPPFNVPGGRRIVGLPLIALGALVPLVALREWAANERAMRTGARLPRSRLRLLLVVVLSAVALVALAVAASGRAE